MDTVIYLALTGAYIALVLWGTNFLRQKPEGACLILILVTIGLVIDNSIIAAGSFIGEGEFLRKISLIRFYTHAFFTPLLVLFGWKMANVHGVSWAKSRLSFLISSCLTLLLIAIELIYETLPLKLVPIQKYGVLRYASAESSGPPIMVIILILCLLAASYSIWRKTKKKMMLIGVLTMLFGSAVPIPLPSSAAVNAFELFFIFSLWMTFKQRKGMPA